MEIFKKYIKKEDLENIMKILGNNKKYAEIMLNIPNIKKSFDIYIQQSKLKINHNIFLLKHVCNICLDN